MIAENILQRSTSDTPRWCSRRAIASNSSSIAVVCSGIKLGTGGALRQQCRVRCRLRLDWGKVPDKRNRPTSPDNLPEVAAALTPLQKLGQRPAEARNCSSMSSGDQPHCCSREFRNSALDSKGSTVARIVPPTQRVVRAENFPLRTAVVRASWVQP